MNAPFQKILLLLLTIFAAFSLSAQEHVINVHFLYGSKPGKGFREIERKWFGGMLGGHVGIEIENDKVLNFVKSGKVHWFSHRKNKRSRYRIHSNDNFWGIFRYPASTVKKATVAIPITEKQKNKLDSISRQYLTETPYDYAFFGMRCGAATYEILGQLGVVEDYSFTGTYLKIFYPKKLRKRLLKMAEANQWSVIRYEGSLTRKWESD
jgi:hypothetical protein